MKRNIRVNIPTYLDGGFILSVDEGGRFFLSEAENAAIAALLFRPNRQIMRLYDKLEN